MDEIFRRISVRKFEDRPVEDEKIDQILRAAMAAPSAGNQQPWEFYVVKDRETIEKMAKCSPYARCAMKAPAVIVPCMKMKGMRLPEMVMIDLSIATQNILLEITSLGLGGVWLGVAPVEERMSKVDEALGIGDELRSFALVPVGYPAEDRPQEDRYSPERVHRI
ncbi:MAG: nitroreductase family protein [Lachnospiraceae bacterium]|nr:nitroreductase family protein [Lachnospiraceae bacterium]